MGVFRARWFAFCLAIACSGCAESGALAPVAPVSAQRSIAQQATSSQTGLDAVVVSDSNSSIVATAPSVVAYVQKYGIHTVFLGIPWEDGHTDLPKGDPATVAALDSIFAVADVYILTGDDSWQLTPTVVPQVVSDLISDGAMYPFKGIVYDLEPQALPQWKTDRQGTIAQYVQFLTTLFSGGCYFGKTLVAVAPYYAKQLNASGGASPSLLQQVETVSSHVNGLYVMNYGAPESRQAGNTSVLALSQITLPFWWGSTTDSGAPPGVSYFGYAGTNYLANMQSLRSFITPLNAKLQGLFDNSWSTTNESILSVFP